jgi:protein tyrosine phosphatase
MSHLKNLKNLTISIDEIDEIEEINEETKKEIELKNEIEEYNLFLDASSMKEKLNENERQILLSKNNNFLNELLNYMEGENYINDISIKYINSNPEILKISKSIFLTKENLSYENLLNTRNLKSEFKILKLITETENHRKNQIEILKNIKRNNNRYLDILPFNFNYVPYQNNIYEQNNQNEWYINASYINGPFINDEKCFIAAQAPLKNSIPKFYKMIFNNNIKLIIMLCSFEEEGRKKCEYYLPKNKYLEEEIEENKLYIKIIKEEKLFCSNIIKREIEIKYENVKKTFIHIQMLNWPDYSFPDEKLGYETIKYIIECIAESRKKYDKYPVLIHCSAGVGRTGTLIAIFNIIKCISFFKFVNYDFQVKPFFSVFNIVRKLREQRWGMVSCHEQYIFIYKFLFFWILNYYS